MNNRTTALRIPGSSGNPSLKRIEHRVSSSKANPYLALSAILLGTYFGIKNKLTPIDPIWGNAFDPQYKLDALSYSYDEAIKKYQNSPLEQLINSIEN